MIWTKPTLPTTGAVTARRKATANLLALAALVVLPFLIRLPELAGWLAADPMARFSGLASQMTPGFLQGQPTIDPYIFYTSLNLGHLAAVDWFSGIIPWWNPFEGVGAPLAAEMQCAAFFPLTLLLYFDGGQIYFHIALQVIAGISTYLLLRQLGVSRIAALTGGLLFEFNGSFAWLREASYNPVAFLPLLLLGIEQAWSAARQGKPHGWQLVAVALALSLYAGFPEAAYLDGLLAACWVVVRLIQGPRPATITFSRKIFLGGVTGLMLAAPVVVPFLNYLPIGYLGMHDKDHFAHQHLEPSVIAQIFMPYIYGPVFGIFPDDPNPSHHRVFITWCQVGGYLGVLPALLVLFGLRGSRERALRLMLFGSILIMLGKIYGFAPVVELVNLIPMIKQTAMHRYCWPAWELAAILLAAFALDDLRLFSLSKARAVQSLTLSVTLFLILPLVLTSSTLSYLASHGWLCWTVGSVAWATSLIIGCVLIVAFVPAGRRRIVLISSALVVESVIFFAVPETAVPRQAHMETGGIHFLRRNLGLNRFYTLNALQPNCGSYFGLASINQADLPVPKRWADYITAQLYPYGRPHELMGWSGEYPHGTHSPTDLLRQRLDCYQWVGVKYVIARPHENPFADANAVPSPNAPKFVYQDKAMDIYELPNPRPYFQIFDGSGQVQVSSRTELDLDCTTKAKLVRRELFFPGWAATVNGVTVPIRCYLGLFQEIDLAQGHSHIRFNYFPPYTGRTMLAFVCACLLLLGSRLLNRRPREKELSQPHSEEAASGCC